jgi:hypothetical protein
MQILGVANSYASAPVDAPTSLSATPVNTSVSIAFTAPTNDGGSAITNYEYSFDNSLWTALSPTDAITPVTISGLTQNTAYTIYLRAVNVVGSGPGSSGVSFTTQGVSNAPTSLSATVTTTTATVSFTAPTNNGGSAITNYEYSFNNSSWTALSPADALTPITISGLTANTSYTIYLRAVNTYGGGTASTGLAKTTASDPISIQYLVIAGGGTGGNTSGGGGGAGGYRSSVSGESNGGGQGLESALSCGSGTYTVTVGGASASSVFSTITATAGSNGGGSFGAGGTAGTYGYSGGASAGGGGAGGGGAGGAGQNGQIVSGYKQFGGSGGAGISSSVNGTSTARAGGGGGGGDNNGQGAGTAGGGTGGADGYANTAGTANTGGGGGGGGSNFGGYTGGLGGGSGIVIVRYLTSAQGGWTVTGGTITTSGSYRIHTFTSSSSLSIS